MLVVLACKNFPFDWRPHVFVYQFHPSTSKYIPDGIILPPSLTSIDVDIENDQIFVPINNYSKLNVVSVVYKKKEVGSWMQYATLTADPTVFYLGHFNGKVCIHKNLVFTTRFDRYGYGVVYVHDMSQINESTQQL